MKVTFIGSGHGVPEPNRKCSCILLEVSDKRYLIDAGTDPNEELIRRGILPDSIDAVFITHMHGDHVNGLLPFIDLCSWFYQKAKPVILLPDLSFVAPIREILRIGGVSLCDRFVFRQVEEGLIYKDDTVAVTAIRTGHTENSYGYRVEAEGKRIVFTGDMKGKTGPTEDYPKLVPESGIDMVVAECAHFDGMLYQAALREHPPRLFCINHYSWNYIESCYHLKAQMKNEQQIILATDGLEITV